MGFGRVSDFIDVFISVFVARYNSLEEEKGDLVLIMGTKIPLGLRAAFGGVEATDLGLCQKSLPL